MGSDDDRERSVDEGVNSDHPAVSTDIIPAFDSNNREKPLTRAITLVYKMLDVFCHTRKIK
jgi:hypothetical protein